MAWISGNLYISNFVSYVLADVIIFVLWSTIHILTLHWCWRSIRITPKNYYKVRWNYFKLGQLTLLQSATGITKCDDYYKLRQYNHFNSFIVLQEYATIYWHNHTPLLETIHRILRPNRWKHAHDTLVRHTYRVLDHGYAHIKLLKQRRTYTWLCLGKFRPTKENNHLKKKELWKIVETHLPTACPEFACFSVSWNLDFQKSHVSGGNNEEVHFPSVHF